MRKLKSKRGVTIMEMLCVLVVVVLLTAIMVTGIELGAKSFIQSVSRSEAVVLCSTLSNAVKDELRFASFVTGEGESFTYWSNRNGQNTYFTSQDDMVALKGDAVGTRLLISKSNYSYGNTAKLEVTYDQSAGIFNVHIQVINKDTVVTESTFQVQCMNT